MGVYLISAVTWIPDRWNHNQPSSLLMYNPQQAVTELYNSSRNGPPAEFEFQMLQVQMSSLPHSPPMTQLPDIQWNHFCVFVACISWCTFLWTRYTMLVVLHGGGKKNWAILWEARIFYRMCQQKPEHAFFCSHRTRCVFALWESVVVKWKEADTQVTAKGDRTFKGNIKAVMWRTGIIGVAKSEADWWIFKDRHESSNL